jgi:hypothetical protein
MNKKTLAKLASKLKKLLANFGTFGEWLFPPLLTGD